MYQIYYPPKKKKKKNSGIFIIIIILCMIGTGLWFGSSWLERQKWQDSEDGYSDLINQIEELEDEKDSLQDSYDALQTENQQLLDVSFKDDFETLQTSYQQLEDQKDSLNDDYATLTNWYNGIREEVNQRLGDGGDEQLFITPDDEKVAAKVQQITGGFSEDVNEQWADLKSLYDWVANNIDYNWDTLFPCLPPANENVSWQQDYWRMPGETLDDGVGDCEDMATLLTSMILNYSSSADYPCWCITWYSNESGHAAVAFPVEGDELTILDPAGNYYTGTWYSLGSESVSVAVNDWLAHWQPEPGIHVSGVFSDTVYETFNSTQEFINWVLNG